MGRKSFSLFIRGNLTVEASLLFPLILWLVILLLSTAFILYNRCLLAQDTYILSYRGSVFTDWPDGYGEVIYGKLDNRDIREIRNNIENRITGLKESSYVSGSYVGKYPFFIWVDEQIIIEDQYSRQSSGHKITVIIQGKAGFSVTDRKDIKASAQALADNPIAIIRRIRRNGNAGD